MWYGLVRCGVGRGSVSLSSSMAWSSVISKIIKSDMAAHRLNYVIFSYSQRDYPLSTYTNTDSFSTTETLGFDYVIHPGLWETLHKRNPFSSPEPLGFDYVMFQGKSSGVENEY